MPIQKPGRSKQDYETPDDFIRAFKGRFGPIAVDLAASAENTKGQVFFTEEDNSLNQDWWGYGNLWLNPPYANIEPWAEKCAIEQARCSRIFMLVPASVGSNWYSNFVEPYAFVFALNPRLTFKGCTAPYPKDCILACYLGGLTGFRTWRWK